MNQNKQRKKATDHRQKNGTGKGGTGAIPDRISEKMTCISHGTAAKAKVTEQHRIKNAAVSQTAS